MKIFLTKIIFFDRVLCSEVIEHVLEPRKVLEEIYRVLKNDGLFSLSIPNEKIINSAKSFLIKTGLINIFYNSKKDSGWELTIKNNLNEWHLHSFSLKLAKELTKDLFIQTKVISIPNPLFPARFVIQYKKNINK